LDIQTPTFGVNLKLIVTQIEKEMLLRRSPRTNVNPIVRTVLEEKIAGNFVKLTPPWRELAESALSLVPAFIIGRTQSIMPAILEAQNSHVLFLETWELEGVHIKCEDQISA
jgi:hypothetical protein